ncbi:uncharacterized protein B0T15DRAFT_524543 [Chaetomium strumarium]|uniref:Secreted protein n=1 Tax=Chaetomium strumarium TaxID=1170767 RepID=A0AAJ0GYJ2_9PEZI|nr:hypothetical protein B0T15DRAFT_524543 [Chaetomium strumarium]
MQSCVMHLIFLHTALSAWKALSLTTRRRIDGVADSQCRASGIVLSPFRASRKPASWRSLRMLDASSVVPSAELMRAESAVDP